MQKSSPANSNELFNGIRLRAGFRVFGVPLAIAPIPEFRTVFPVPDVRGRMVGKRPAVLAALLSGFR